MIKLVLLAILISNITPKMAPIIPKTIARGPSACPVSRSVVSWTASAIPWNIHFIGKRARFIIGITTSAIDINMLNIGVNASAIDKNTSDNFAIAAAILSCRFACAI